MKFTSLDGTNLLLEVTSHNPGSVEIVLRNEDYEKKLRELVKLALVALTCGALGQYVISDARPFILVLLGILESFLAYKSFMLFKEQQIIFISCIGFQISSTKAIGTTTKYIPLKEFHDIVINEVIHNFNIKYILLLRTKSKQKPIFPLLEPLNPPLDCLEEVYQVINRTAKLL